MTEELATKFLKDHNIDCSLCGACCFQRFPQESEENNKQIAKHLDVSIDEVNAWLELHYDGFATGDSKHCWFYDYADASCRIYPVRPMVCRNFPANEENKKQCLEMKSLIDQGVDIGEYQCITWDLARANKETTKAILLRLSKFERRNK